MRKLGAAVALALLAGGSFGATCTYNGAWDTAPTEGDDIIVTSGDMTWSNSFPKVVASWTQNEGYAGTVTFDTGLEPFEVTGSVSLLGGTWTHAENPSCTSSSAEWKSGRGTKQLIVSCGGDFTLGAAAKIDVVGKGYAAGQGPGCNVNGGSHGGAGASHGGAGVIQSSSYYKERNIGPCYGSAKTPVTIGSGGGGARGGGAVRLAVGGKLDVRGPITAKGADTTTWYAGSGGSIYLSAAKIVGAGPLCAAGGAATNDSGGGGGRIALYVTGAGKDYADYTGEMDVSAFAKSLAPFCGTVYRENKADNGRGELWIKGYNAPTSKIPDPLELSYQTRGLYGTFVCDTDAPIEVGTLKLTGHARLHVPSNVVLSVTGFESENDGAWTNRVMLLGGKLSLAKDAVVTDLEVAPFWEPSDIVFDDDVTDKTLKIAKGGRISPAIDMTLHGDLRILSGGSFSHYLGYPIALTVPGDCTIDAGGAIDVSGRGYVKDTGPGKSTIGQTGGSHGGRGNGGNPTGDNGPGSDGSCYGSVTAPVTMGSGGRYGTGGGAIKLTVADTLTVNGAINANGGYSDHYSGAGGSAWILTKRLLGSGPISANGGLVSSGGERNGTGGGGRVAVWMTDPQYDFSEYTGAITAYGGSKPDGKIYGGAGTVYRKLATEAQNEGTLVIDNGLTSQYKNYECRVDPLVTDADVGTVIVTNNATFAVTNNATFTFRKQWIVSSNARFRGYPGSTVVCAPCGTKATMSGESTFYNFTCDAPGKTIEFDVNATCFGVAALGTLTLQGDETAPLTLASSVEETPWLVKADGAAVQAMKHLTVIDSDATAGALMVAENATGTRCSGWNFVNVTRGETLSWTGLSGTGWTDPGNWDGGRAPSPTDNLVVTNAANQPVLNADVTAWSITVAEGASLALNGFSVAVSNLTVAGSLTATGAEILEVTKNVDFTGGTFAAARSTLRLVGAADQSVTAGGVVFTDVIIEKDGGLLAFTDAFAADRVRLTAVQPMAVTFAAGKLFAAREITFAGLVGNAAGLRLASSDEGSAWLLKASDYAFAAGVSVSDSDARSGLAFRTGAPSVGTNCEGWDFSAAPFVWTGAVDAYFTNAANWAGGVAPGAADDVRLDAAGEIVLDAPLKLRSLEIGGGAAVSLTVNEPLELSAGLVVDANGTFVANTNVTVGGTVIVRKDGVVTHGANGAEPVNKLSLAVRGDVLIEEDGKITAYAKGYAASWKGPGAFGYGREAGASHGGRGCGMSSGSVTKDCYGSAFRPETFGTSGNRAGGGVIRLTVDGTLTVDGSIDANGEDHQTDWYSGAGGSVWLTAARLLGRGVISANGGDEKQSRPGGGGRVAIYLTQDTELGFGGSLEAKGGRQGYYELASDKKPLGAAGTVYVQCADAVDGAGTLIVDNGRSSVVSYSDIRTATDMPAAGGESGREFEDATLVVSSGSALRLTADVTVNELEFASGCRIYLDGHTLTIRSLKHRKRSSVTGYDYTGTVYPGDGGAIRFLPRGLMLFVR